MTNAITKTTVKTAIKANKINTKYIYHFGDGKAEGSRQMSEILGGKGANLAEMCNLGLPVPPGFTISTSVCAEYYSSDKILPTAVTNSFLQATSKLGKIVKMQFGDEESIPLLLSVRSGARVSMPGMMDTILNLGLNDKTVLSLAKATKDERFAYDSYRRFIQMYGDVVMKIDRFEFEEIISLRKQEKKKYSDTELDIEDMKYLTNEFKAKIAELAEYEFPQNIVTQLEEAINAVLDSWMLPRAVKYRQMNDIPDDWGTAVNIQTMVFGNMGSDSATGVAFTRNPSTGEKEFYGEYLINAQGEDVVAGIRTPNLISKSQRLASESEEGSMEETLPKIYKELVDVYHKLEKHACDMQDIEFTVQRGKLWMLQTRNGKRTAAAAIKIATDMVDEKLITKEEAILRIQPESLNQLLHPRLNPESERDLLTKGLPASPGAASGIVVFSADEAERQSSIGNHTILVRLETSPEDIHGMDAAEGILTARGGMTSHAAVVARGMGKPCVCGVSELEIDYKNQLININNRQIKSGDLITIDGATGEVFYGEVPTIRSELSGNFAKIMDWSDSIRSLKIFTNAETPRDVLAARDFGAEGIGLCRTEHMFFASDRIGAIRGMILADNKQDREKYLEKLLPIQQEDFTEIFKIMDNLPVTIRLLDPPLHEFLPHGDLEIKQLADELGLATDSINDRIKMLHEQNPMLGHRGCRLGITYPEIYEMQAKAIFLAAKQANSEGKTTIVEIMIPLIMHSNELRILREMIERIAIEIAPDIKYSIGTMIELPAAALRAGEIAKYADFFSFGTNDLTQTALGLSRDDSANFIREYKNKNILPNDPFMTLDEETVGRLIGIAVEEGRRANDKLKIGICGEHGGDPTSIEFCQKVGLDYVSCSPFRVPIARLAAAHAKLKLKENTKSKK